MTEQVFIRPDIYQIAAYFQIPVAHITICRQIDVRFDTFAVCCRHNRFANLDEGYGIRDTTIILDVLIDEYGVCYGLAAKCPYSPCGRIYAALPTKSLLETAGFDVVPPHRFPLSHVCNRLVQEAGYLPMFLLES